MFGLDRLSIGDAMIEIPLLQGSQQWLDFRKGKISGTDAASIANVSPYTSAKELYELKLGMRESQPINQKMLRGQNLEPIARDLACKKIGMNFTPAVIQSSEHFYMMASLDGLSDCKTAIMEIKCFNEDGHQLAIDGNLYPYVFCQCQHNLETCNMDLCYYISYRPEHTENPLVIIEVYRCPDYCEKLVAAERDFYFNYLTAFTPPPEPWRFKEK